MATDPDESKPILTRNDTQASAAVRKQFEKTLDELEIDCRNLWVYSKDSNGKSSEKRKVERTDF